MKVPQLNLLLAAVIPVFFSISARSSEYYKEISRKFKVNSNVTMKVNTSFASTTITTWDSEEVYIMVKVNADVRSESRADEIFNSVKITESQSNPELSINPGSSKKGWGNESYDITVEIKMPKSGGVSANVDFGNLSISSIAGILDLHLDYGNLVAADLKHSANDIEVDFGNTNVAYFGGGKITSEYGNVKVENVNGNSNIQNDFGNTKILKITKQCSRLDVGCDYGNVDLRFEDGAGGRLEAFVSYGDIDINTTLRDRDKHEGMFDQRVTGNFGSGDAVVKVNVSFGNIEIK
jgi:hypothetical protein